MAERDRLAEAGDQHAGLLLELAPRGAVEVVVGLDEAARQRPPARGTDGRGARRAAPRAGPRARSAARRRRSPRRAGTGSGRTARGTRLRRRTLGCTGHPSLVLVLSIRGNPDCPKRTFDRVLRRWLDQRDRILDATLGLMARGGAHGTSMRAVAGACELNVATLYHYFPSKRDLLQAAIAHRRAADLPASPFPEGLAGQRRGPARRALLDHLFVGMTAEEDLWRALIAEAIHGDDDVFEPLLETANAFEHALAGWLRDLCPDAPGTARPGRRARDPQRGDRRPRRAPAPVRGPARGAGSAGARARARFRPGCSRSGGRPSCR